MSGPISYLPIAARKWSESYAPLGPAASGFFRGLTSSKTLHWLPGDFFAVAGGLPELLVGLFVVVAEFFLDSVDSLASSFKEPASETWFLFQHLLTQHL